MRNPLVLLAATFLVILAWVIGGIAWNNARSQVSQGVHEPMGAAPSGIAVSTGKPPGASKERIKAQPDTAKKAVPIEFDGFEAKSFKEQKVIIERVRAGNAQASTAQFEALLTEVIPNVRIREVLRNVAADVLIDAKYKPDELWKMMASAAVNERESDKWRDYAMQHMSNVAILHKINVGQTEELLARVASAGKDRSDTALLLWYRLVEAKVAQHTDKLMACAINIAGGQTENDNAIAMALTVGYELGNLDMLQQARVLSAHRQPHVRRAALAILGRSDVSEDRAIIERMAHGDSDASVRMVATNQPTRAPTK